MRKCGFQDPSGECFYCDENRLCCYFGGCPFMGNDNVDYIAKEDTRVIPRLSGFALLAKYLPTT